MEEIIIKGEISSEGFRYPRSVHRFIEKRIERFIRDKMAPEICSDLWKGSSTPGMRFHFHVSFQRVGQRVGQREGGGHSVHCNIEIRHKTRSWWAHEFASGPHQALTRCLARLQEKPKSNVIDIRLFLINHLIPEFSAASFQFQKGGPQLLTD